MGREVDWDWLPGACMPFGWRAFVRKYRLLLEEEPDRKDVVGQMAFRAALLTVGQLGWALDEVIARKWRRAPMHGPIFIIGHQRSGTTFLHRLLATDRTNIRALKLHEMILPAVSVQDAIAWIAEADARGHGRARELLDGIQERLFGPLDDIHKVRFEEIEEDEFVLWTIFASAMCVNDAPSSARHPALDDLRRFPDWTPARKARALGWYRACLLKKLHREARSSQGSPPWIVSKNPAFTHKVPALREVFPDARFILLIRNPLETIPSRLSLIQSIWRRRFPGFEKMTTAHVENILADSLRTYLSAEQDLPGLPERARLTVEYRDLCEAPAQVVRRIYRHFELPDPDPSMERQLAGLSDRSEAPVSAHHYALENFGLDEAKIRGALAPVFERYEF